MLKLLFILVVAHIPDLQLWCTNRSPVHQLKRVHTIGNKCKEGQKRAVIKRLETYSCEKRLRKQGMFAKRNGHRDH